MRATPLWCMLSALWLAGSVLHLKASNGAIAYIYPLSNITIDGRLNDWPEKVEAHPMEVVFYGDGIEGPEDGTAAWRAGYDASQGVIYVAVTMRDDDYVKTPDNSHYTSHDFQVLYIDPLHSPDGSGVIAYEIDEDHHKIVEQESLSFYPQVREASFDQVEIVIVREGEVVTYEWKVKVKDRLSAGQVIGFDYAIFDKDTDQDHVMITWGNDGGTKFQNSHRIGDLVLMEEGEVTGQVKGSLAWSGPAAEEWPTFVRLSNSQNPHIFFGAQIDSLGKYELQLPAGIYRMEVTPSHRRIEWNVIDLLRGVGEKQEFVLGAGQSLELPTLEVEVVPRPELMKEEGLLMRPFSATSAQLMDEFVASYCDYYNIPAVSLALIQDGEMVYHQTYGVENTATERPLRDEAVFEAASITKLVFSYVINRLVQRGEFDLDRPLHELVPFPDLEEYPEYKLMTGRHVLTHVTGLPNWGRRIINTPGTTFGYSGEGFEYLKTVLAGGPTDDLPQIIQGHLERELLHPLGMTNTYFMCNDALSNLKVAGHFDGHPNGFDCPDWPGMAFSMHTEARDFVPFALALLNRTGLTVEQAANMFSFHTLTDEEDWLNGYKMGFGLGVALRESPHGLVFGHGGNNGDFRCSFEMYDELGTGYIVFTNADTAEPFLFDLINFLVEGKK